MRSGAYQQPAWCWHLVWGSKESKIQKKQFHADLQKSNWKIIYCVLHIIWRVPHSDGTGFGRFLEPGVLTCARPRDTVTTQPSLRRPFNGTWELQVGCTTWDELQESESKRVWLQSFVSVQDGHRAFSVCIFWHVSVSSSFLAHFKTVTTHLWLSLHPQKPQGSLTASNGQKLMPNLQPSCKFRLFINDHPWLFMIHISDYRAEVRTNTALQSPENPPRLDTLDPAANMRGRSR